MLTGLIPMQFTGSHARVRQLISFQSSQTHQLRSCFGDAPRLTGCSICIASSRPAGSMCEFYLIYATRTQLSWLVGPQLAFEACLTPAAPAACLLQAPRHISSVCLLERPQLRRSDVCCRAFGLLKRLAQQRIMPKPAHRLCQGGSQVLAVLGLPLPSCCDTAVCCTPSHHKSEDAATRLPVLQPVALARGSQHLTCLSFLARLHPTYPTRTSCPRHDCPTAPSSHDGAMTVRKNPKRMKQTGGHFRSDCSGLRQQRWEDWEASKLMIFEDAAFLEASLARLEVQ